MTKWADEENTILRKALKLRVDSACQSILEGREKSRRSASGRVTRIVDFSEADWIIAPDCNCLQMCKAVFFLVVLLVYRSICLLILL